MIQLIEAGKLRLAVLASGRGSNFDTICQAIDRGELNAEIKILISDHEDAPALEKAAGRGIDTVYINPHEYQGRKQYESVLVDKLKEKNVDIVVLAGYMRLVGETFLNAFKNRIVNIHPALLPAFPGLHAQKQAVDYGARYSGCTVHIVDQGMDTGPIIMQSAIPVYDEDDEDSLSERILIEEHKIYWQVLQLLSDGRVWLDGRKVYIKK